MKLFGLGRLFARERDLLTAGQVIWWWEKRRLAYNFLVGSAGLFGCVLVFVSALLVDSRGGEAYFPDPPLFVVSAIILYAIVANLCYAAGWICELLARRLWPLEAAAFGRLSFIFGLFGSIILTLLPSGLIVILSITKMLTLHPKLP